ncbi:Dynein light chain LC6, flagellar outer arm [Olea europaea subsp. europaea]|uniref:Dynein light chain LC6, flagellar outer arm n=1 Tax=Olea europaea subsp. europaea TaxID=158383 RepID=A0A8S0SC08_OLEEU|nr:Dynein light chain LC6, flagellar outer arm [Olea europaea subsp. europaea]
MDPTQKKHPKSTYLTTTTTTKPHHHHLRHPLPDSTTTPPSSIQSLSNRFSKLYANHKKLASLKTSVGHSKSHSHPEVDTNSQAKSLAVSSVSDISGATLTKSNSHHHRNNVAVAQIKKKEQGTRTKVKEENSTNEIKKECKKSYEAYDVKKAANLMSRSAESEQIKKLQQGFEITHSIKMNGGRRRSFCSSEAELADFFTCSGVKVVSVDMPPFMQIHAVDCARKTHDSLEKFTSKTLALTLKKEFDGVYGPAWHCIVGTSFGSFVTHSVGGFIYFSMDNKLHVLLFKTTVHKAH